MSSPITVVIADDHETLREGLKILLEFEDDLSVIGEAQDGAEAVQVALASRPDVIVMDVTMPNLNGLEATRRIREELPNTNVLLVSADYDDTGVEQALACGALGFISKHTSLLNVPNAIRQIHQGNAFFALNPAEPVRERSQAVE